jgi:hypothetical protein
MPPLEQNRLFRPIRVDISTLRKLDRTLLDLYSLMAYYMEPDEYYCQTPTWFETALQSGQHDSEISALEAQGLLEVERIEWGAA